MFGIMLREEADIGIACITPRRDIHALFDFTIQYLQVILSIYFNGLIHLIYNPYIILGCNHLGCACFQAISTLDRINPII